MQLTNGLAYFRRAVSDVEKDGSKISAPDLAGDGRDLQGDEKDENVEGDDVESVETVGRRETGRSAGSATNRD